MAAHPQRAHPPSGVILCGWQTRRQRGCCPPLLGAQTHPHPLGGPPPLHRHAVLVQDGGERLGVGRRLVWVGGELAHAVAAIGAEGEAAGVGAEVQAHLCGGLAGLSRGERMALRPGSRQRARTTMKRLSGSCTPPPPPRAIFARRRLNRPRAAAVVAMWVLWLAAAGCQICWPHRPLPPARCGAACPCGRRPVRAILAATN
jgi:hypothetical protein